MKQVVNIYTFWLITAISLFFQSGKSSATFFPGKGCGTDSPITVIKYKHKLDKPLFLEASSSKSCALIQSLQHLPIQTWIPGQIFAGEILIAFLKFSNCKISKFILHFLQKRLFFPIKPTLWHFVVLTWQQMALKTRTAYFLS